MSKILYIGDYYPLFSYKVVETKYLTSALRKKGNEVFLLSKSWCTVKEDSFYGSVDDMSQNADFVKRYYLDPVEIRSYGKEIINCFVGLGCKIIEIEKIDCIIFDDDIDYSLVVEILKQRYSIPCYLMLYDGKKLFPYITSNYIYPYISMNFNSMDAIFTCHEYAAVLKNIFHVSEERIIEADPYITNLSAAKVPIPGDPVYVVSNSLSDKCTEMRMPFIKYLLQDISDQIIIWSNTTKKIKPKSYLLHEDEIQSNATSSCSFLFASIAEGYYPLIFNEHIRVLGSHDFNFKKYGNFTGILSIKSKKTIADYF